MKKAIRSLYVHIPFCVSKCNYCDFVSYPLKDSRELCGEYASLLLRELAMYAEDVDMSHLQTVYIGGGTPTIFPDLLPLIESLPRPEREFTVEANPGTVSYDLLCDLRFAGVNRLSFGVQSFDDGALRRMGRLHRAKDAIDALYLAREAGFDNISIDLIYGLPGQSAADWRRELAQATALDVPHISAYALTLAEGTPWGEAAARGELITDEDGAADMLLAAGKLLGNAGYRRYEISNFARAGYECLHNMNYWRREDYLGIGVNAASCIGDRRFANLEGAQYAQKLKAGERPVAFSERLTRRQIISESIFLALRTDVGLNMKDFAARFGADIKEMFAAEIAELKSMKLIREQDGCLRLTPAALPVSNQVFCRFV